MRIDPKFQNLRPASEPAIVLAENKTGVKFPESFRQFLSLSDGGAGLWGTNGYLHVWSCEELPERNSELLSLGSSKDFVSVGSNGGGEALVIFYGGDSAVFGYLPFIDPSRENFIPIHRDFWTVLEIIGRGEAFEGKTSAPI